jgi:hypothetical protein
MPHKRTLLAASVFATVVFLPCGRNAELNAQGVTTATIEGSVRLVRGENADGARIRVTNRRTGYVLETRVRSGRFALLGLDVGGPYSLVVQKIGYRSEGRNGIVLSLGQRLELDFNLESVTNPLDTIRIIASREATPHFSLRTGVGKLISDSALHRLPTIDRELYEFVRLTPQVVSGGGRQGLSGGGLNTRFNSFLLDGVSDRGLLGNLASGKSISIDAIKEYQVLLAPYSVRYGDFTGALVNAVTKGGSNELEGVAFVYQRNDDLARDTPFLRAAPYSRTQFGLAVGGPIIRDRAHFFIAPEFQQLTSPAAGPYVGQNGSRDIPLPVSPEKIGEFAEALKAYGIEPGSAGAIDVGNPLRNLFARIDFNIPEIRSRLVLWNNYASGETSVFSRVTSTSFFTRGALTFPLSSFRYTSIVTKDVGTAQLLTNLPRSGLNELMFAFKLQLSDTRPEQRSPLVSVAVPRSDAAGTVYLEAGSNEAAHGISVRQTNFEIADDLTLIAGMRHRLQIGARAEFFSLTGRGLPGSYGSWLFSSLDALRAGKSERFRLASESEVARSAKPGVQVAAYAGDEWQIHERFSVEAGVRADIVSQTGGAPYNAAVDSLFGRRTSDTRAARLQWSPRIGFSWNATQDRQSHVRGGIGVFVGRPPLGWLNQSLRYYGGYVGILQCGPGASGPTPAFVSDYQNQPVACADGGGAIGKGVGGQLDFIDSNARLVETLRASLSYDRRISRSLFWKMEGLVTRNRADFLFVNMNLAGPAATDRHGRVLYGLVDRSGRASPILISSKFSEAIDLRNQSRNHSFQLATEIEKRQSGPLVLSAFYAYSRAWDVLSPPNGFSALDNWQSGRVLSREHSLVNTTTSLLEVRHRIGLSGTYAVRGGRWATDVAAYYVGESGAPFTYIAAAGRGRGDLNADGTNLNDPIYIPRNAFDTAEIMFDGLPAEVQAQQDAMENLIRKSMCLDPQRGSIMRRNSCRAPWVNLANLSIRQKLPTFRSHVLVLQLDIFNVLNLLSSQWGQLRVVTPGPNASLLEQVGQTAGPLSESQPLFRLNEAGAHFDSQNVQSAYQLQLGLRYTF